MPSRSCFGWCGSGAAVWVAALALVALLVLAPGAQAADRWTDITDEQWVATYGITALQAAAVADGYADGTFAPYQAVTRAQFAKMAVKGLGLEVVSPLTPSFADVPVTHPLYGYVEGAKVAAIIGGYLDGSFRPDAPISRQQANSMLGRFLSERELQAMGVIWGPQLLYSSLEAWSRAEGMFYLGAFVDLAGLDGAHRPGSAYLVYHDVVHGSQNGAEFWLYPTASLSRAQAVTMVLRTLEAVDQVAPEAPPVPRDVATFPAGPSMGQRPWISGKAIPGGTVTLYGTFAGNTRQLGRTIADSLTGDFSIRVPETEPLAEGTHVFTLRVRNKKGLQSDYSDPVMYEVDLTPPTVVVTVPLDGGCVSTGAPAFGVAAEDGGSGVASATFEYAEDGEAPVFQPISTDRAVPFEAGWGVLDLPDGHYLLRATVADRAGNTATAGSVRLSVDRTPPVAAILLPTPFAPGAPALVGMGTPSFTVAATDPAPLSGIATGMVRVDFYFAPATSLPQDPTVGSFVMLGSDAVAEDDSYEAHWGTGYLPDGSYVLAARGVDRAGNHSPLALRDLVVDTAAPQVGILAPSAGEQIVAGTPYVISWQAHDAYLLPHCVTVALSIDDGLTWSALATGIDNSGSLIWDPASPEDLTQCRLRVEVMDALGHVGLAVTERFTILAQPEVEGGP